MGIEEFSVSLTNRSLRTVKNELEFLANNSIITQEQLSSILGQLPAETAINAASVPTNGVNNLSLRNGVGASNNTPTPQPSAFKEKQNLYSNPEPTPAPPPAYAASPAPPPPPAATPSILAHAVALYVYNATDAGDLNLQPNDRVGVTEYMNAEWWKGRNERTGQEGIFPRSYVRVEEKNIPAQPSNYGNVPMDVSSGAQGQEDPKKKGTAAKIGGKLGNAAIFGAGATIGSNIVNSIF